MKLRLEYRVTPKGKWKKTSVSVLSINAIKKDVQEYLEMFSQNEQVGSDKISLRLVDDSGWETWKHESDQEVNSPKKLKEGFMNFIRKKSDSLVSPEHMEIIKTRLERQGSYGADKKLSESIKLSTRIVEASQQKLSRVRDVSGTSRVGQIQISFQELTKVLGKPTEYEKGESDDKIQFHWGFEVPGIQGQLAIYDYKISGDAKNNKIWSIGATRNVDVRKLKEYFPSAKITSDLYEEEQLNEEKKYSAWQMPSKKSFRQEYDVEYKHHVIHELGNIWPTFEDFEEAIRNAEVREFNSQTDRKVSNRSRTSSKESLLSLIKSYRSYPQFRNEKTIDNLYSRIENNEPLDMPIILNIDGKLRIMAGNTRADVALQTGNTYKAIVIDVSELNEAKTPKELLRKTEMIVSKLQKKYGDEGEDAGEIAKIMQTAKTLSDAYDQLDSYLGSIHSSWDAEDFFAEYEKVRS